MGSSTFQTRETCRPTAPRPEQPTESAAAGSLVQRLAEQMIERWRWGERPRAEEYLERYPELRSQPEAAIELIYEEICLRREYGQASAIADVLERFPHWRAQLQVVLDCHELLEQPPAVHRLPNAGESLGDFQLLAELGRGARGRVFLATQPSLAGRPVVAKVTPRDGREHLSLGRLQHTHIVPLYSVQDHPECNLRVLCMPYFGGATLAYLLGTLRSVPPARRSVNDLLAALDRAPSRGLLAMPAEAPARRLLSGQSYVRAICWIGACLADALQYAQERDLIHLDLKPSNVLLAADGQPMLLDFHLACAPIHAGGPLPDWLGGTPAYMSPEQQLGLAAVRGGQAITQAVDGRSDVYALGLVLYEALGGVLPCPATGVQTNLRQCNAQVSIGLADVLGRCLAHDAGDRYDTAGELAEDLRRHVSDLPLKGVANRSLVERWRKWRRRRPHTLTFGGAVSVAAALGVVGLFYFQQQVSRARTALDEGNERMQARHYGEAAEALKHGLMLAGDLPGYGALKDDLQTSLERAVRAREAENVHILAEGIRRDDADNSLSVDELRALEKRCGDCWERRQMFALRSRPRMLPHLEQQLTQDFLEVAIVRSNLRVRLAAPDAVDSTRRDVVQLFIWVEGIFGRSPVLEHECRLYAEALGLAVLAEMCRQRAAAQQPAIAWEHYAIGRTLLRAGNAALAARSFASALEFEPQQLWAHFYNGKCAYQLKHADEAVVSFTACIILMPDFYVFYYNRALAHAASGHTEQALADFDRAIELARGEKAAGLVKQRDALAANPARE